MLRRSAAVLIVTLFAACCFVTGTPAVRTLLAFVSVVVMMVAVEFSSNSANRLRSRERWRFHRTPMTKARFLRGILYIFFHAFVARLALLILLHPRHSGAWEMLRLIAGAALLYGLGGVIAGVLVLLFLAAGYSLPPVHRHPVAARSVEEFWARRWNIVVSAWLHTFVFLPFARRRRYALGILLAFLVSGLLHGWLVVFAVGIWAAFTTTLFFVIQGVVILAENRLRIRNWPVPLARAWTVTIILGTSPLFIDPGLRLFGL